MIRLEAEQLEQLSAVPLNFFGIRLEWFIGIMAVVCCFLLFAGYQWWQNKQRNKNFLKAKGNVLIEFLPTSGAVPVERLLCQEFKGEAKKIEAGSRGTFTTDMFAKHDKDSGVDNSIDVYFLLPEHNYQDYWPYGAKRAQQVSISKYYFRKNQPWPEMPHDASKWSEKRYTDITSALAKASREEAVVQATLKEVSGAYNALETMVSKMKLIPIILIVTIVGAFIAGMGAFLSFRGMQVSAEALSAIVKFITGK